jgi:DNA-binding IclR family transcriptional regulator
MKKLPAQPIQGLIDGLSVIQELAVAREPLSGKYLSEKLGVDITKVNRLLKTLDYLDIAHRNKSRKYSIGPGMHILAVQSMLGSGLVSKALPVLEELQTHGHVVALGVLWRDTVSYLYHASPETPKSEAIGRVALHPARTSSVGMLLLSQKEKEEINSIFTDKNEVESILPELQKIKNDGYAAIHTAENIISVAVKIGEPAYAGLAISGKLKNYEIPGIVKILKEAAEKIT